MVWKGLCVGEPPFHSLWETFITRPFSQYIFPSLVHKGNLNKRFELQSSLIPTPPLSNDCYLCQENKEAEKMREGDRRERESTGKSYPSCMKWENSLEIRIFFSIEKLVFYVIGKIIIHRKNKHFQGFHRTFCLFLNAEEKLQLLPYL